MNPWIILGVFFALIIFGIDFLVRRKRWNQNTRDEKISLIVSFVCGAVYLFMSAFGLIMGIVGAPGYSEMSYLMNDIADALGAFIWVVSLLVVVLSIVLRKLEKTKLSQWIHAVAIGYIALVFFFILLSYLF